MSQVAKLSAPKGLKRLATAFVALSLVAGCGGGSDNTVLEKPGVALYTSAGTDATVQPRQTAEFTVGGGGGGTNFVSYSVSSSDIKVAVASITGGKLSITGIEPGDATVVVTDSAGASVAIAVKVPAIAYPKLEINSPDKITLTAGLTSQYKLTGGKAPYRVAIGNPNVVAAVTSNDAITITAANPGTATLIVYDDLGNSDTIEATVTAGTNVSIPLYTTAPDTLRVPGGEVSKFAVHGGVAPYTVTSTNPDVVQGSVNANELTIEAKTSGQGILNIRDASGVLIIVTVTVVGEYPSPMFTTAPAGITVAAGGGTTYQINGGTPPYIASSSNYDVARANIVSGDQINILGISAGVADVMIFDSTGTSVKVAVTVGGGTGKVPLYSTAPDSITVLVGATPTYRIAGGAAPYSVESSNVEVATVTQETNTFTVTGVKTGMAVLSIRDANGSGVTINVDVQ